MRSPIHVLVPFVLAAVAATANAQGCPNPQTGPLIGTTGEWCLSTQDGNTVNWNQPLFMTTTIGPQTSVTTVAPRTICRIWWENPTCWFWIAPPAGTCCGTVGRLSGCGPVFFQDSCLSLSQAGQQLMQARAAACPLPTMPPPVPCGPTQSICVTCPCPVGWLFPCERIKLPVRVTATSNVNFIDCIDFANWTDLNGAPASKQCFWVRQKCVEECLANNPTCANSQATNEQIFGCFYVVPTWDFSDIPDVPAGPSNDPENDEHNPVNPQDGGGLGGDPR